MPAYQRAAASKRPLLGRLQLNSTTIMGNVARWSWFGFQWRRAAKAQVNVSQIEGFLSSSLSSSVANIRADFAPWFDAATAFNTLGMRVLPDVRADQSSNQQLVSAALYGRLLTSFQTAFLLAERGLLADARTVVRGAAESAIVLAAVAKDATVCDLLIDRHFWHHRKLRQAWLNDPQATANMTAQEVDAVRAVITDADVQHPKAKTLKNDPVAIATLAQQVGFMALYNAVYRSSSGDAAHTSIDALSRHIRADDQANITGLKFGPDVSDLPTTLSDAISVLGHALHSVTAYFKLAQFEDELAQCAATWKALGVPSDFRPGTAPTSAL